MKYSMTCSCGDAFGVDAGSREEAVSKMKGMMTADAIKQHGDAKHKGEEMPSMAEVHKQIEMDLEPA